MRLFKSEGRLFLTLALLFFSSVGAKELSWNFSKIHTPDHRFDSISLKYLDPSPFNGLRCEIFCNQDEIRLILNLLWCPLTNLCADSMVEVEVTAEEGRSFFLHAYSCRGDQKLIFSTDQSAKFVKQLTEEQPLAIKIGMYETKISCQNFMNCWRMAQCLLDPIAFKLLE